ncbi:hypothetical protein [Bradyrhizobium sp. USDA 3364]
MNKVDDPEHRRHRPKPEPSRLEEALRIVEEYAKELREIVKKLGPRLN